MRVPAEVVAEANAVVDFMRANRMIHRRVAVSVQPGVLSFTVTWEPGTPDFGPQVTFYAQ